MSFSSALFFRLFFTFCFLSGKGRLPEVCGDATGAKRGGTPPPSVAYFHSRCRRQERARGKKGAAPTGQRTEKKMARCPYPMPTRQPFFARSPGNVPKSRGEKEGNPAPKTVVARLIACSCARV
ncbi:hypothetical protein psal_cds_68 [Pandoravirus salinus]|uniref:Uncharacterized protein n=1 Tax=Pandoravirus salinus TaxID=1349410 RepID=A0A291ATD2_9VIRU|nr:hypothetical protein psal_cds_68 [Pandoravirus salinus]ATE82113.1 hypothetical protein psal_cds_68 [Pandoravirus salinus]